MVRYRVYMSVPLVPILSQINPFHTLVLCFFKIYFNSIHTNEVIVFVYISYILTFIYNSAPLTVLRLWRVAHLTHLYCGSEAV